MATSSDSARRFVEAPMADGSDSRGRCGLAIYRRAVVVVGGVVGVLVVVAMLRWLGPLGW